MKRFTACGFPSAQQLVFLVCYPKHVEALAALALWVAAESCGRRHVLLASSGNNVCRWMPGRRRRVQGQTAQRECMACLHHHFSSRKAIVLLPVELCSSGLSSLVVPAPAGHPLELGSPLYLPVVGFLFLLLLLLLMMR